MITTVNGKLSLMEMDIWEPAIPIVDTGTLGNDDRQQFIWGFPEVLWQSGGAASAWVGARYRFGYRYAWSG